VSDGIYFIQDNTMNRKIYMLLAGLAGSAMAASAYGHGFVGNRFFPATITTDDPFAVDEFSLSGAYFIAPGAGGDPKTEQLSGGFEFVKEIFPKFAVGINDHYFRNHPSGERNIDGWDNLGVSLKYEVWRSEAHEAIFSIGLDTDIGGTGTHTIGESTTTFTPTIYFGKGFGDLPDGLEFLKPFAITGTIGESFPTDSSAPNTLQWGFALEYSLPYLQQHVEDLGLPEPFKSIIPVCEFSFETPENRGGGVTTGTINPGLFYETRFFQLGAEVLIPVNSESGNHVGVTVNLQIYIDDLFSKVFGHPVFGER
jgi:hypothetical protein